MAQSRIEAMSLVKESTGIVIIMLILAAVLAGQTVSTVEIPTESVLGVKLRDVTVWAVTVCHDQPMRESEVVQKVSYVGIVPNMVGRQMLTAGRGRTVPAILSRWTSYAAFAALAFTTTGIVKADERTMTAVAAAGGLFTVVAGRLEKRVPEVTLPLMEFPLPAGCSSGYMVGVRRK